MKRQHNYLKVYRHLSPLSQRDIAFLLGLSDVTIISKYERSHRPPKIEVLTLYHVLFDVPVEILLPHHIRSTKELLESRIDELMVDVSNHHRAARKVEFLNKVRSRLFENRL